MRRKLRQSVTIGMSMCLLLGVGFTRLQVHAEEAEMQSEIIDTELTDEEPALIVEYDTEGPTPRRVYGANPDSQVTIDQYLGVTGDVVQFLEQYDYEDDGTYSTAFLSTPYFENLNDPDSNLVPNMEGADGVSSGMNCVGFVGKVLRENGGDLTRITNRLKGWYANASNWNDFVDTYNIKSYRFTSIASMLSSGVLQKGDIIYFEPTWANADDDCHMGFFWGDTSSSDLFWNTSMDPWGNWITSIQSKSPIYYIYVFSVSHETGSLEIYKSSSDPDLTEGNPNYSFEGAVYGLYYKDFVYDEPEYTITLDADGYGRIDGIPKGEYYVRELQAPPGYEVNENWYNAAPDEGDGIYVSADTTVSLQVEDVPVEQEIILPETGSNGMIWICGIGVSCMMIGKRYEKIIKNDGGI